MPGPETHRRKLTLDDYCRGVLQRDMSILPRALTLVESTDARDQCLAEELLSRLLPHTGGAIRVGVTGAPGAGKSTFIETLGMHLVEQDRRVAVLAIDPSSDVSGGSVLGDKTRMKRLSAEPGAYVRPSPAAGALGGVARKTRENMLVCEAAGFDIVLIETVGVGQSETMVANMTDCFLALMLPGAGDELQGIKRGLLELADVIAVNKADGPNRKAAEVAARQLSAALHSFSSPPPVLTCSARNAESVAAVWQIIEDQFDQLKQESRLEDRRQRQNLAWLWNTVDDALRQAVRNHPAVVAISSELERDVLANKTTPRLAAQRILDAMGWTAEEGSTPEQDARR